jgi:serine/threonine protein kinase
MRDVATYDDAVRILRQTVLDDVEQLGALKQLNVGEDAREQNAQVAIERMHREISGMRAVKHPSLLAIRDANPDEHWYVSEFHPGGTLTDSLGRFAGGFPATLRAVRPLVEGVAELHKAKYVHRDIKPDNVFLAADGRFVLGDFGLAYFTDDDCKRLSLTLENVGSRDWMPFWAQGMRIEQIRSTFDVFSLGKLIWAMVMGGGVLRGWYFNHPDYPEFDVTKRYPDAPHIGAVNELLSLCVVEHERQCRLSDAEALRDEIDRLLRKFQHGVDWPAKVCRICGEGKYQPTALKRSEWEAFGLRAAQGRSFQIHACDACGHVELFTKVKDTRV